MLQFLLSLFTEPILLLLSLVHPRSKRDHFAPHPGAPFEGYYTRIVAPHATILLILSSVRKASHKPHFLHFSYLPTAASTEEPIRVDLFPSISDEILEKGPDGVQAFQRTVSDGIGYFRVGADTQTYELHLPDGLDVAVTLSGRTPWIAGNERSSPEGALGELVHLLPIHWNVFSTRSLASFSVKTPSRKIEGVGAAHMEKNWGMGFPKGWVWVQALSPPSPPSLEEDVGFQICLAGGQTLGQKAYLLAYSSSRNQLRFAPPVALLPMCLNTPFISEEIDSRAGRFKLSVADFTHKLCVTAQGPAMHRGWVGLHCPLKDGHGNVFSYETFEASVEVVVFRREWWGGWREVEKGRMEGCALEFGGEYSFKVLSEEGKFD